MAILWGTVGLGSPLEWVPLGEWYGGKKTESVAWSVGKVWTEAGQGGGVVH